MTISARTKLIALFGDPVSHSLSPALHNSWIEALGLDAAYVALRIGEKEADAAFASLAAFGFHGANVTVPHKARAARAAQRPAPAVVALGAANTLLWEEGGVAAFNTDAQGAVDALDDAASGWREGVKSALIVGAGGAAKAVAFGLRAAGVSRISVVNRTRARAAEIEGADIADWAAMDAAFADADLIVQTTTLGMKGQPPGAWPIAAAKGTAIVMDAVYAPLETPLLKAARMRGLQSLDGLGMLLFQAARAFEIWFGVKPDIALGRKILERSAGG
ncbi:MAG: shikimate dehydrogenase [Hydrogenophilaceae bacterium]|jgi:shikimate dehydrogenase|nr:shikimate dehydrogenase [Hydrogenophilaceae bacterium]